jgi:hypothetical protein
VAVWLQSFRFFKQQTDKYQTSLKSDLTKRQWKI